MRNARAHEEAEGKGPETTHRYDIRSRKRNKLADQNNAIMDEEHGSKEKGKTWVLVKPKEESGEVVKDSHQV
jgi:hypothetical protein